MSKGPGRVQSAIINTFESAPEGRFTVAQLAARAYPSVPLEKRHLNAVHAALIKLTPVLGLSKCRVGALGRQGWRHVWGRS
jgi:hypothetical protein